MYSGALFIQQSVGWDLYVSIFFLLGMTALCTVSGMLEKRRLVFILDHIKAMFTLLRFRFYPFLLMKTLPVHIAPFSNEYAMKTIGVHTALAKRCC